MKETIVINLYASSGSGKSTLAAALYSELKLKHVNCELAREYVKRWVWEQKIPSSFEEQLYIFGKQSREESLLYKNVDVVVTDSPLWLPAFFEQMFFSTIPGYKCVLTEATKIYTDNLERVNKVKFVNFWLDKLDVYKNEGRYETAEKSLEIHENMFKFLKDQCGLDLIMLPKDHQQRMSIVLDHVELLLKRAKEPS